MQPTNQNGLQVTPLGPIPTTWDVVKGKLLFQTVGGYSPSFMQFASVGQNPDAWYMKVDSFNDAGNADRITRTQYGFLMSSNPKVETLPVGTIVIAKRGAA